MRNIGMLVAVEIQAVLDKYGTLLEEQDYGCFKVRLLKNKDYNLYILNSGAGEIAAAAGVQFLITKFNVDLVLNFGVVGGLTKEMALAKTCVVEKVVHYDFDTSELDNWSVGQYAGYDSPIMECPKNLVDLAVKIRPDLVKVTCASADKFVGDPAKKAELHQTWNADICEMEAAAILLTCNRNSIPCLMIKTVSDSIGGGPGEFVREVNRSAEICLGILDEICTGNI